MKRDHNKRLETLEAAADDDRVTQIDILGASACDRVAHNGGVRWVIATGEQTEIPAPPCPLGEACTCRSAA